MNRASRYLANVTFLAFVRVVIVVFCVCICHQVQVSDGKVFERCELAQVLRYGHGLDVNDVANWVCIAQHSSSLNTSAFGGNARSGGSHGLFQISDQYWCSPPGKGVACGVTCDRLRDDDISDDLACVQIIYQEHQRLSGDGYNAWIAYESFCRDNPYEYVEDCFGNEEREYLHSKSVAANVVDDQEEDDSIVYSRKRGKVYGRCELAKELFLKHKMPMEEIPTWVCIAQHESNYDTSAVGRLNVDGSADHGLFQISDLYWCHHKGGRRKGCGMPCSKFLDADITDDVKCIKQIHKEHTRISGDGFTAWTVYNAYCSGKTVAYVRGCFDGIDVEQPKASEEYRKVTSLTKLKSNKPHGKVYEPCELADELRSKHHMPEDQIATWVCIAKHESDYNTSAIGYGDHGLFQISDIYWCSPPGKGWACGLSCADLEDSDITDDVECIRKIHREHTKLTGDGFNAWTVYPRFCSQGRSAKYIAHCPSQHAHSTIAAQSQSYSRVISPNSIAEYEPKTGKVYGRCELAKELLERHKMGMHEIPTWVCIAHHESNYDTSAIGRLNADGSADHGIFQISDLFWCSHKEGHRKACGLPCSKLLDNDISDDVRCVKQIHEEHTRISGDGFTAWTVYTPYCKEQTEQYIRGCFDGSATFDDFTPPQRTVSYDHVSKNKPKGKVFEECELASELRDKHHVPREQIATWVCIAQHQSGLNTSSSVSDVHGLFHISDEYWCSPPGKGKSCNLHCADLEDSDISDDVECIQTIYQEHQRLFGDGFNAWVVYPQHCSHGRADDYIGHCPGFQLTNTIYHDNQQGVIKTHPKLGGRVIQVSNQQVYSHEFQANPFLKHFEKLNSNIIAPSFTQTAVNKPTYDHVFNANPFLKHFDTVSGNVISPSYTQPTTSKPTYNHEFNVNPFLRHYDTKSSGGVSSGFYSSSDKLSASASEEVIDSVPVSHEYSFNQFSKQTSTTQHPQHTFSLNPFLKTISSGFIATTTSAPAFSGFTIAPTRTKSKISGFNGSYQPQNEEKAKFEAFKSLATSFESNTQTPRANRLQTYNLNTFKSPVSSGFSAFTTPAPATTRVPWYQLNTLSSAKPIFQSPSTSGYFFNRESTTTTRRPFSVTSFTTVKPQRVGGYSFNNGVVPSFQTTTSRPFSVNSFTTKRPSSVGGYSFNGGVVSSTQASTSRPFSVTSFTTVKPHSVSGFSFPSTSRPFSVVSSKTQKPLSFSFNRATAPTIQTSTTRPFTVASYTTKAPQTSSQQQNGRYDSGHYDSGRYDAGRYDSGRYNSGKYNPQPVSKPTLKSVPTVSTAFSNFGHYPTPTPSLQSRQQTTNRITITTLRPSSQVFTFTHPNVHPQNSRFLSKSISSDQDDFFKSSIFTTPSPQSSSGSFSISESIPGVKITNVGNIGVSIHRPTSAKQDSGQYLPKKTLLTPSSPTDGDSNYGIRTVATSRSSEPLYLASSSDNSPLKLDSTSSLHSSEVSFLPGETSLGGELYIIPSFTAKRQTDTEEALKSSEKVQDSSHSDEKTEDALKSSESTQISSQASLKTDIKEAIDEKTQEALKSPVSTQISSQASLKTEIKEAPEEKTQDALKSSESTQISSQPSQKTEIKETIDEKTQEDLKGSEKTQDSIETYLKTGIKESTDEKTQEALKSSEKTQVSSQPSLKTEITEMTDEKISPTSTKDEEPSSTTELKTPSSIIPSPVDSSATTSNEPVLSPPTESSAEKLESTPLRSSKTETVKQPSTIPLKPIAKTSSAFTAGSTKFPIALKPTSTTAKFSSSPATTTKPSLRQVGTLTATKSLPSVTAQSSVPARSPFTSQSKPYSVSRPTTKTTTIQPTAASKSKQLPVVTIKPTTTTRSPTVNRAKPTTSATTTSRSKPASYTQSKSSLGSIKSAPTNPARPAPTPTLKKSEITTVTNKAKPRKPAETTAKPSRASSPLISTKSSPTSTVKRTDVTSLSSGGSQVSGKLSLSASKPPLTPTRAPLQTSKPTSIFTAKPSVSLANKKSTVSEPSQTSTSTRSSRSTRSITASSSPIGAPHPNSIIVTKPIFNAQSKPANSSPARTGLSAAIIKTSAVHSSPRRPPTRTSTVRATSAVLINPTKSHRPTGPLFSTKLNIYDFYYKLYGVYPPIKTSSALQPATKTSQVNVVSSRTS